MAEVPLTIDFDEDPHSKIQKEYDAGNFTSAVKTAILFLTECIRDRTDLVLDGDSLVTRALSPNSPLIRLNSLSTQSEIDEQTGHMMILQGVYKSIRNPRNHNLKTDDKFTCDSILTLINFYVKSIKTAKTFFDFDEIVSIIKDRHFDRSKEYADEIAKTIPDNKRFDTLTNLIRIIDNSNFVNIAFLIRSSIELLEKEEREGFHDYCSNLLHKTDNHTTIKALVFALSEVWNELKTAARIRIEGMLIQALKQTMFIETKTMDAFGDYSVELVLKEEGHLAQYLRYVPVPYTKKVSPSQVDDILMEKLTREPLYAEFVFEYFDTFVFGEDGSLNTRYENVVCSQLDAGNQKVYEELTAGTALECVAREVVGNPRATLGEIIKRESGLIPKPLDEAVAKAWGYASEHARHIREGRVPSYEEAELVVGICASVSTYLVRKSKT